MLSETYNYSNGLQHYCHYCYTLVIAIPVIIHNCLKLSSALGSSTRFLHSSKGFAPKIPCRKKDAKPAAPARRALRAPAAIGPPELTLLGVAACWELQPEANSIRSRRDPALSSHPSPTWMEAANDVLYHTTWTVDSHLGKLNDITPVVVLSESKSLSWRLRHQSPSGERGFLQNHPGYHWCRTKALQSLPWPLEGRPSFLQAFTAAFRHI